MATVYVDSWLEAPAPQDPAEPHYDPTTLRVLIRGNDDSNVAPQPFLAQPQSKQAM